jgi:hypothetical protein
MEVSLKIEFPRLFRRAWLALTEVPGWPDAPRWVRLRRMMPMIVPCVAALGLTSWTMFVREPAKRAERAAYQPLIELEDDVAALQLACSEQQANELQARADEVSTLLLSSADDAPAFLDGFRASIRALGWEATFQNYDAATEPPAADALVGFAPARVRLTPVNGAPAPFPALLAALEQFLSARKRIDLTRLAVRADEPGRTTAEVNLRVAFLVTHEKTPQ